MDAHPFKSLAGQNLSCPSCGAELTLKYPYAKMVVCGFCAQTSYLTNAGLDAQGEKTPLADYASLLALGKRGALEGLNLEVYGRIRFDYLDGFWDEWLLIDPAQPEREFWLQEDEGEWVLFERAPQLEGRLPSYESFIVAENVGLNGKTMFVTEKSRGKVNGGEGELPFRLISGERCDFVDGLSGGLMISIEFMPKETVVFLGKPIDVKAILNFK